MECLDATRPRRKSRLFTLIKIVCPTLGSQEKIANDFEREFKKEEEEEELKTKMAEESNTYSKLNELLVPSSCPSKEVLRFDGSPLLRHLFKPLASKEGVSSCPHLPTSQCGGRPDGHLDVFTSKMFHQTTTEATGKESECFVSTSSMETAGTYEHTCTRCYESVDDDFSTVVRYCERCEQVLDRRGYERFRSRSFR